MILSINYNFLNFLVRHVGSLPRECFQRLTTLELLVINACSEYSFMSTYCTCKSACTYT